MGWESIVLEKAMEKLAEQALGILFDNLRDINRKLDLLLDKDLNTALDYLEQGNRTDTNDQRNSYASA
jgi:hypothetical protein